MKKKEQYIQEILQIYNPCSYCKHNCTNECNLLKSTKAKLKRTNKDEVILLKEKLKKTQDITQQFLEILNL